MVHSLLELLLQEPCCPELPIPQEGPKLSQLEDQHGSCHCETGTRHSTHYFPCAPSTGLMSKHTAASSGEHQFKDIYEGEVSIMGCLLTSRHFSVLVHPTPAKGLLWLCTHDALCLPLHDSVPQLCLFASTTISSFRHSSNKC